MEDQNLVIGDWDSLHPDGDASRQAKVNALRELQSASGEELSALMAPILVKAFEEES